VVDTGEERRNELVNRIPGLYDMATSQASCKQRAGRAGRTKSGVYILCSDLPWEEREVFTRAEIERSRLDQVVLRLAEAGFDATELEFFHQPNHDTLVDAKRVLRALGAFSEDGSVTKIGHQMAKMPIGVKTARMVIEAERLGVVDDVITIAAIIEQGDITAKPERNIFGRMEEPKWKMYVQGENESDALAQLAIYKIADTLQRDQMAYYGIFPKAYFKAREIRNHLAFALRDRVRDFTSSGDRENILRAVAAGMVDHLYRYDCGGYTNGEVGVVRELNRFTVIYNAKWVVGEPWDLEVPAKYGGKVTLRLIRMATKVNPEWLMDVAPQLVEVRKGLLPGYDEMADSIVSTTEVFFNGQKISESCGLDPDHPDGPRIFAEFLASRHGV
jgi:HrpA-like RNA helicase